MIFQAFSWFIEINESWQWPLKMWDTVVTDLGNKVDQKISLAKFQLLAIWAIFGGDFGYFLAWIFSALPFWNSCTLWVILTYLSSP